MIDFSLNSPNQLLLNPKLSDHEKITLSELKNEFEKKYSNSGCFLLASSGSSQKINESVKLVALKTDSVLNSARRFNSYFKAGENDHWGLVLPEFHVAGLSVYARAHLAGSKVFVKTWQAEELDKWIEDCQIGFMSLVPTQVYDLIQKKIKAPACLKKVFVGASALNEELRTQMRGLNWPVIETYGMTETSSMIAVKENELFQLLPGVDVKLNSELLAIKCNSLATVSIQKIGNEVIMSDLAKDNWYQTQDKTEIITNSGNVFLRFLGRDSEYYKILGEGVSLSELRSRLVQLAIDEKLSPSHFEILCFEDDRAGYKPVLVAEESVGEKKSQDFAELFNSKCRPYEKIRQCILVRQIPRTDLGKLKTAELNRIVKEELKKVKNG